MSERPRLLDLFCGAGGAAMDGLPSPENIQKFARVALAALSGEEPT